MASFIFNKEYTQTPVDVIESLFTVFFVFSHSKWFRFILFQLIYFPVFLCIHYTYIFIYNIPSGLVVVGILFQSHCLSLCVSIFIICNCVTVSVSNSLTLFNRSMDSFVGHFFCFVFIVIVCTSIFKTLPFRWIAKYVI